MATIGPEIIAAMRVAQKAALEREKRVAEAIAAESPAELWQRLYGVPFLSLAEATAPRARYSKDGREIVSMAKGW